MNSFNKYLSFGYHNFPLNSYLSKATAINQRFLSSSENLQTLTKAIGQTKEILE